VSREKAFHGRGGNCFSDQVLPSGPSRAASAWSRFPAR